LSLVIVLLAAGLTPPQVDDRFLNSLLAHVPAQAADGVLIQIEMVVRPDGTVQSCDIKKAIGQALVKERVCPFALRQRLRPAKVADGTTSYGVYRAPLWAFDTESRKGRSVLNQRLAEDMTLVVNRVPKGITAEETLPFAVLVEPQGNVSSCEPKTNLPEPIVRLICDRVTHILMPVVSDDSGRPAPYITRFTVSFVLQAPGDLPAR